MNQKITDINHLINRDINLKWFARKTNQIRRLRRRITNLEQRLQKLENQENTKATTNPISIKKTETLVINSSNQSFILNRNNSTSWTNVPNIIFRNILNRLTVDANNGYGNIILNVGL